MLDLDCASAASAKGNAGCSFFPVRVPINQESHASCFAMYVVNPGMQPVKLNLSNAGAKVSLAQVARLPRGGGQHLSYDAFDEAAGLPPGAVAILFLAAGPCPDGVRPATDAPDEEPASLESTLGQSFHLTTDRPVVAYQIIPYGGAGSHVTAATLLLPQEAWGQSYVVAAPNAALTFVILTAAEDGTEVALRPSIGLRAGVGVPAIARGKTGKITLAAGQTARIYAEIGTLDPLSGSVIASNKPISVVSGVPCFNMPIQKGDCDSAHQQLPPLSALGHEYVAVRYRDRRPNVPESVPWQLVGAADRTTLTYAPAPPAGAPATLAAGQVVIFSTRDPFVVRSQDAAHSFYMAAYMTGFTNVDPTPGGPWPGDPDFVNVVPAAQYLSSYVFFTDPTYPDTNLVVVRARGSDGRFADVSLGCSAAPLSGWMAVGDYEYTRVDLVTGDFQPMIAGCDNGRQTMKSAAPFGVTVWGWGSQQVKVAGEGTGATSYAYPAGASVLRANDVQPRIVE